MDGESPGRGGGEGEGRVPPCFSHPGRPAVARCVSCGRTVCLECVRRYGFRHFCPRCLPDVRASTLQTPLPWGYHPAYSVPVSIPTPAPQPPEPADPGERRWWRADWKLSEVAVALLLIFGVYNALGVALFLTTNNPLFYSYLSYALFFCPLILISAWWLIRRHGRTWEEAGLRLGQTEKTVLWGFLGSVAALFLSYASFFLIYVVYYNLAGRPPVTEESRMLEKMRGGGLALVLAVAVVLAPLFEELFFRGLLYPALRRRVGSAVAVLLNGVIFGALHFQPLFMLSLMLVGAVLAYLYERTGSLVAPMIAHALYNLCTILITLFARW